MTAINTNTAALNAQYYLSKTNKDMESTMAKLSSGQKVNSAADDAAGLAIASRMTAQIRGLAMAVKNSNDSMSLAQTAEGAMEEVTNMLQRIRELAVQSANGTMNSSDRESLDAEVQALKSEIDRVASTTQFNSQNLLDGSYKAIFQIGDKAGQNVGLTIGSVKTTDLGMGSSSSGGNSIIGARIDTTNAVVAGDIKINGQDVGAIAAAADMEKVLEAINNNVDNVEATAFNVVVAKQKGNGVTTDGQLEINVAELGQSNATTFKISASSSMEELVENVNAETGGVVKASINDDGKLVLANDTGATIKVLDTSASASSYDGGSGFYTGTSGTYAAANTFAGFVKLTSLDGSNVRVERGNSGLASAGAVADLEVIGFRETAGAVTLDDVRLNDAYTITGKAIADATHAAQEWAKGDLTINGVEIYEANVKTDTVAKKIEAINNFTSQTGVVASATIKEVFDLSSAYGATSVATDDIVINGQAAVVGASISVLVTNINANTANTGVTAEAQGQNLVLYADGQSQIVLSETDGSGGAATESKITAGTYYAGIRLDSTNDTPISIALGDSHDVDAHGFLEANVGAADFEVNDPTLSAAGGSSMAGLTISTASQAENAITTLDNAINRVNEIRGNLGAIQNRLEYTINNLSSISNATSGARGRILDADFAKETSELTKHQILTQAATSMLAQANQSKQGILALLQG